MHNKIPVQFRPVRRTLHTYQRLKYCRSCSGYSVLFEDTCQNCGAKNRFISVTQYAAALHKWLPLAEACIAISLVLLAVFFARNLLEMAAALVGGTLFLALYFLLRKRYKHTTNAFRLQKLLVSHTPLIVKGLRQALNEIVADVHSEKYKDAYEKLREVGYFLDNDSIRIRKIMCLNYFVIRKDMDLELETVVPLNGFDKDFIRYLWDVAKVKKPLVRDRVLQYVVIYQEQIESLRHGKEVLTTVAGAALRMKSYVARYPGFFRDYLELLPRERFLRLCHIVAVDRSHHGSELYLKAKDRARTHYAFDPDFHGIF